MAGTEIEEGRPVLFAGEVDTDSGQTFVLRGRVVTMNPQGDVFPEGQIVVHQGKIVAVQSADVALSPEWSDAISIETHCTLYPGLMDLHNHFVYNVLPLWVVPKRYANRTAWPGHKEYTERISLPLRALASDAGTSRALVRYVETKAIFGGTTTGQGIRTRINGKARLFHGVLRNAEETDDSRLPEAGSNVPNLFATDAKIKAFANSLQKRSAYFYHLAEGTDDPANQTFQLLKEFQLLQPSLVGIHSLGLHAEDLNALAAAGAKVVWSPFSNLLLYGQTLDLKALRASGVTFSLGCDWSPSGSTNLLQELKVAQFVARQQAAPGEPPLFSDEELVRAVTSEAARVVAWEQWLGSLEAGKFADILAVAGTDGDPYTHLIQAVESQIRLVVIHGTARYGDTQWMQQLHPSDADLPLEPHGNDRSLALDAPASGMNNLTFAQAQTTLRDALNELHVFRAAAVARGGQLYSEGEEPEFSIELDNELDEWSGRQTPELMGADFSKMAASLPLDSAEVPPSNSDAPDALAYWKRIESQPNLPDGLSAALHAAYHVH